MAIGHAKEHAIPFGGDDSKEALHFLLRQCLDDPILPSWFFQGCLRFHNSTEYSFCCILATTTIEKTGPRARAVS
jgi:hypothetical protein